MMITLKDYATKLLDDYHKWLTADRPKELTPDKLQEANIMTKQLLATARITVMQEDVPDVNIHTRAGS